MIGNQAYTYFLEAGVKLSKSWFGSVGTQLGNAAGQAATKQAGKGIVNLTKAELRSISSYKSLINDHQTKLAEYIKDPFKFDNKGFLRNAPNDAVRQKIIQKRINHLNHEIQTFQDNIQKILNKH